MNLKWEVRWTAWSFEVTTWACVPALGALCGSQPCPVSISFLWNRDNYFRALVPRVTRTSSKGLGAEQALSRWGSPLAPPLLPSTCPPLLHPFHSHLNSLWLAQLSL